MPDVSYIFARVERKYMITRATARALLERLEGRLLPDEYGHSTVANVYLDTRDFRLIRASIDADNYKEKLRIRAYGDPGPDDTVFLEIKKKFDGVVYKRRLSVPLRLAERYVDGGERPVSSQVMDEFDYAMRFWGRPGAAAVLCYERDAYYARDDHDLRLTFDTDARCRFDRLHLSEGDDGIPLFDPDTVLLEIKFLNALPLWLTRALDELGIRPTSYSKYGTAYRDLILGAHRRAAPSVQKGEFTHAATV
ncbi:MAG: polyphosphate polymerase domain-containing protein [Clostridia bacterium]|nr:polyphosphate polymerase domain-containing protein [Clostridia bacterium]